MAKRRRTVAPVSRKEIASMTRKLDAWGATLPAKERAVLQVLIGGAQALQPIRIPVTQARTRLAEVIRQVFMELGNVGKEGWARIDPIWYKSNAIPTGEEGQITGKILLKGKSR